MLLAKCFKSVNKFNNSLSKSFSNIKILKLASAITLGMIMNGVLAFHQAVIASPVDENMNANLSKQAINNFIISSPTTQEVSLANIPETKKESLTNRDGIYLYGQSPSAGALGSEYLVFKVTDQKIVGSIYFPQSEFNCFQGELTNSELKLSILEPDQSAVYPYSIALGDASVVATTNNQVLNQDHPNLEGYYPINQISETDQQLLEMCQNITPAS